MLNKVLLIVFVWLTKVLNKNNLYLYLSRFNNNNNINDRTFDSISILNCFKIEATYDNRSDN